MTDRPNTAGPITLELGDSKIPAAKFAQSVEAFLTLIREVSARVSGKADAINWFISVSHGSARLHAFAEPVSVEPETAASVVTNVQRGLGRLYSHSERPKYFSDQALKAARTLARIAAPKDEDEERPIQIRIVSSASATTIDRSTLNNIDSVLGPKSAAEGSIEGRIETLSDRKNPRFVVYDSLTDKPVRCYFRETLRDVVVEAFRSRSRVVVSGRILYRDDGQPHSIRAESVRNLKTRDDLPTFYDVLGVFREPE